MSKNIYFENPKTKEEWEDNLFIDFGINCKIEDNPISTGVTILFSYKYFRNSKAYYHTVKFPLAKLPEDYNEFMNKYLDEILKQLSI